MKTENKNMHLKKRMTLYLNKDFIHKLKVASSSIEKHPCDLVEKAVAWYITKEILQKRIGNE